MTHASFCSGIDGPALAASWLGWEQAFYGDINEFTLQVLRYYYPHAREYNDIRTTDLTEWKGRIDVLSIGFPCQPFSVAGSRTGEEHDSYLWPETLRIVGECRPRWFVGENVDGIASMVLPGMETQVASQADIFGEKSPLFERTDEYIIDRICRDLEAIGYETVPVAIPACAVGAPHKRMRIFFIAFDTQSSHSADSRIEDVRKPQNGIFPTSQTADTTSSGREEVYENIQSGQSDGDGFNGTRNERQTSNANGKGLEVRNAEPFREKSHRRAERHSGIPGWRDFPTQSPVCGGNDGLSGLVSGIAFSKWVTECITALGNGIVPQQILEIYKMIEIIENTA